MNWMLQQGFNTSGSRNMSNKTLLGNDQLVLH